MARAGNVNELLDGHVVLDLECLDRIYLNAYMPTLQVGGLLEITPWVLSWGAAVEVLSPPQLRRSVAESVRAQAARYSDRG